MLHRGTCVTHTEEHMLTEEHVLHRGTCVTRTEEHMLHTQRSTCYTEEHVLHRGEHVTHTEEHVTQRNTCCTHRGAVAEPVP